jgi:protocatechuate 3,4-dioxygenase beta subunit
MVNTRLAAVVVLACSSVTLAARQVPPTGQARSPVQLQQQAKPPRGALWGVVVSGTSGQPVDRVRLTLSGSGRGGSRTVYSDDDGRFLFLDLAPGAYLLRGSKTGYVGITYGQPSPNAGRAGTPIQIAAGQQIKDLSFVLPPGGVITGRIFDEKSRPAVGTDVRVMRWEYNDGHRELSSAGSARTDDRGIYRVYGLPPGDYIVSALPRNVDRQQIDVPIMRPQQAAAAPGVIIRDQNAAPVLRASDEPTPGYAPAYHPGTIDIGSATPVTVDVSAEVMGVDVLLQEVPLARVQGTVIAPPGVDARSMRVRLNNARHDVPGVGTGSARVRDGRFEFTDVAPGQYRAVITAEIDRDDAAALPQAIVGPALGGQDDDEILLWGAADVSVFGSDVTNVALALQPGITVSGRIAYDGAGAPPEARRIRVSLEPFGPADEAAGADDARATVDENGLFTITGIIPARYRVEASGVSGWEVASALIGGVDAMDVGLDVTSAAHNVMGLEVVFSDERSALSGVLQDALGAPTSGYTVIVLPADRKFWLPGARRIQATRPSTTGRFSFSSLPPGEYRLAAVTDVENGIWFDPAVLQQLSAASVPFSLRRGQTVTQNLRVGGK